MNEARRRGGRKDREEKVSEQPKPEVLGGQEIVIRDAVAKFIEEGLQPNVRRLAIEKIESLRDPNNRKGSVKVKGRPANDPVFRVRRGNYRIFYKRVGGEVHVVHMEKRQRVYRRR